MLNDAYLNPEAAAPRSDHELRLMYAMAVVRLVNGIVVVASASERPSGVPHLHVQLQLATAFFGTKNRCQDVSRTGENDHPGTGTECRMATAVRGSAARSLSSGSLLLIFVRPSFFECAPHISLCLCVYRTTWPPSHAAVYTQSRRSTARATTRENPATLTSKNTQRPCETSSTETTLALRHRHSCDRNGKLHFRVHPVSGA